jgi:hypothetical protein
LLAGGMVHAEPGRAEPLVADVLIEGARIRAVGQDLVRPAGCRVVEAVGLHLVPGLIDGMAYHDVEHDPLYTTAGVTTIVDHGNDLGRIFATRAESVPGEVGARWAGPVLWISGAVLDGLPPATSEALILRNEHDAKEVLHSLLEEGVDFVAVQSRAPEAAWRRVIELAHAAGRQVWGPLPSGVTLEQALQAQVDGILFLDALLPAGARWDEVEMAAFEPVIQRLAASKTRLLPLLGGNARAFVDQGDEAPELAFLGPEFRGQWLGDLRLRRPLLTAEFVERGRRVQVTQAELLRRLHAAGVPLVPGSGAPHPWLLPGRGLHAELARWHAAGLPAADCLAAATAGAADALAMADRGRIAPEKVADVVLLGGDPRADLAHLARPVAVVVRGQLIQREALAAMEHDLVDAQAREQELARKPIEVPPPELPPGDVLLSGYAESTSLGVRQAVERWAVVATASDGEQLAFVARRRIRRGTDQPPVDLELRQDLLEKKLVSFEVHLRTALHHLEVKGHQVANQVRVERRVDGAFVDVQSTPEKIAAVDVGSVSTLVLLAHAREDGARIPMLRFHEGLELEAVRWGLMVDEHGGHVFSTPEGPKAASFDASGGLLLAREQQGSGQVETLGIVEQRAPGLALSAEKQARIAAREAAAKQAPKQAPKQER